jgi:hypothetical protein
MATIGLIIIGPRDEPFIEDMKQFWEKEDDNVSAFSTGINKRDGTQCIVGGCSYNLPMCLDHCHIIPRKDNDAVSTPSPSPSIFSDLVFQWDVLQRDSFIPKTKRTPLVYPRNGVLMCKPHHVLFDNYYFFIRYSPEVCYKSYHLQ